MMSQHFVQASLYQSDKDKNNVQITINHAPCISTIDDDIKEISSITMLFFSTSRFFDRYIIDHFTNCGRVPLTSKYLE